MPAVSWKNVGSHAHKKQTGFVCRIMTSNLIFQKTHCWIVMVAMIITSCSKDTTTPMEDRTDQPRIPLTLSDLSECSEGKSWDRAKLIKELEGAWTWHYELIFSSHVDTIYTSHRGLKVKFDRSNRLIMKDSISQDTIYYDVRRANGAYELFVQGDTLEHLDGQIYMCEEEMAIRWYGPISLGLVNWYFKD